MLVELLIPKIQGGFVSAAKARELAKKNNFQELSIEKAINKGTPNRHKILMQLISGNHATEEQISEAKELAAKLGLEIKPIEQVVEENETKWVNNAIELIKKGMFSNNDPVISLIREQAKQHGLKEEIIDNAIEEGKSNRHLTLTSNLENGHITDSEIEELLELEEKYGHVTKETPQEQEPQVINQIEISFLSSVRNWIKRNFGI